jgi:hypothetical protein
VEALPQNRSPTYLIYPMGGQLLRITLPTYGEFAIVSGLVARLVYP